MEKKVQKIVDALLLILFVTLFYCKKCANKGTAKKIVVD
jgi:hypothetical protein